METSRQVLKHIPTRTYSHLNMYAIACIDTLIHYTHLKLYTLKHIHILTHVHNSNIYILAHEHTCKQTFKIIND